MGFVLGAIVGGVVVQFVNIMWGHKNKKKIQQAREYMSRTGEKIFD